MSEENESLNYLLQMASLLDGRIKGVWKYAVRILLGSIIRKELMNELSFEVLIKKGVEEGFLTIENNDIILTPNGNTHLSYVFPKLKFSEEIRYQVLRIRDLEDDYKRTEYIKYLENELVDTLEYSQRKRESAISEHILVNGYIGETEGIIWTFSISNNEYITKQDFSAKGTLIQKFVDEFAKKGYNCVPKLGYDRATFFIDKLPDKEIIDSIIQNNFNFIEEIKETNICDLEKDEFEYLLSKILSNFFLSKKLVKIGRQLKFIDFSKRQIRKVTIGELCIPLAIFHGFNMKVDRIHKAKFILWMDPTYMQFLTMDNWIEATGIDSSKEILNKVSEICVLPRKQKGKITEIDLETQVPSEIKEYWKKKYNFELTRKTGMAQVQFEQGQTYSYPLETLCFDKKWIEDNIGFMIKEAPTLSPRERYEKIREWFNAYCTLHMETPFCKVIFKKDMASLDEIKEIFKSSYRLLPPILVFSQRDIERRSTDTRAVFKYGGYAGNKGIFIFKIICPSHISEDDCEEFLTALKRVYESTFGTFEYAPEGIRIPYSETLLNEKYPIIEEKMKRKLEPISVPKDKSFTPITIVVEPDHRHIIYYITKCILNNSWRIPDQHIKIKNFERIMHRDLPLLRGFSLHLYVKSLRPNEPPWILRYPSDGVARSVYCGIGFSMQVKNSQVRKGIGILAICDAQGKFIYQKHLSLSKVTNYLSEEMLQKLFSFVHDKTSDIGFQRLVIYKKGHLKPNEFEVLQKFIKQIKETEYWKNKKIDVVTVEEDIYRLFKVRDQDILNIDSGLVVILNNQEALVCVSGHPEIGLKQGTVKLMHIKAEVQESGTTIKELIREYFDRTFLNWIAPVTLSKYPPELNISQKIAEITKEVDITQDFTYLVV